MHIRHIFHLIRWSNPVLDRLTGGMGNLIAPNQKPTNGMPSTIVPSGLRNDSYYMATNDSWSPMTIKQNNSVLIEDDQEPLAPYVELFIYFFRKTISSHVHNIHNTYSI